MGIFLTVALRLVWLNKFKKKLFKSIGCLKMKKPKIPEILYF